MKLDNAQLDDFFLKRVEWTPESRTGLPAMIGEIALYHILPDIGDARADNLLGKGLPSNVGNHTAADQARAREAGWIFLEQVLSFIRQGGEANRMMVVSEITTVLQTSGKEPFRYALDQGRQAKAIRYFARRAVPPVEKLLQAASPTYNHPGSASMDSLEFLAEQGHEIVDLATTVWSRPDIVIERRAYETRVLADLQDDPKHEGSTPARRWLVLDLLRQDGGYEYDEIESALRCVDDLRRQRVLWNEIAAKLEEDSTWSRPGTVREPFDFESKTKQYTRVDWKPEKARRSPQHPCFVWRTIRAGYNLPEWLATADEDNAICLWFRVATSAGLLREITAAGLRQLYYRGVLKLRKAFESRERK